MNIDEITQLTTTWCRMWSAEPALAHDLMTQDCRQWSAVTAGLDAVVGPAQQERFVTAYRAEHVNVFVPGTIVADGDMFGYLWDVTLPDGTMKTGIDVNVVQGMLVGDNWTFVTDSCRSEPAPGDRTGTAALLALVRDWAGAHDVEMHRRPVLDPENGRAMLLRTSLTSDGKSVGGVDLLTVRDGHLEPVWSITGTRAFAY